MKIHFYISRPNLKYYKNRKTKMSGSPKMKFPGILWLDMVLYIIQYLTLKSRDLS